MVTAVSKVIVPVADQGHAKEFWTQRIGFQVTRDETYGDERQVPAPPREQHFGWWALFEDHDGTRYALGQWD